MWWNCSLSQLSSLLSSQLSSLLSSRQSQLLIYHQQLSLQADNNGHSNGHSSSSKNINHSHVINNRSWPRERGWWPQPGPTTAS